MIAKAVEKGDLNGTSRVTLIDTGPVVALLDKRDANHERCSQLLPRIRQPLFTCLPVLTEADYLLQGVPGATGGMFELVRQRVINLLPLDVSDLPDVQVYLNRYRNLGLQLADACLAHLGDREGIDTLFTLDRRDFGAVVLKSGVSFQLLP